MHRDPRYAPFDRSIPDWFRDAKLGVFVHWGAYSVPAWAEPIGPLGTFEHRHWFRHNPYAEWYANTIRLPDSPAAAHHRDVWGGRDYDDFLDLWRAEAFDAQAFLATVADSGARYLVPVTKHHDGITLWDAPGTGDRNTVRRGPRRDLVDEFAAATRAAGLRFGVYYSTGLDWHFAPELPPVDDVGPEGMPRPVDEAYARYAHAQVVDLIERYSPDVLWGDIDWPDAGKAPGPYGFADLLERLRAANPDAVVNDRWGETYSDYRTGEYEAQPDLQPGEPWEQNRGIGYSFGHNRMEDGSHLLSGPAAVRMFVDVVSRGGNLLLNVGPTAEGAIPDGQRRTLEHLGAWNRLHGAAVFGSRALEEIAPADEPWLRWTAGDGVLHAFADPGRIRLPHLPVPVDTAAATTLDGTPVAARTTGDTVEFDVPEAAVEGPVAVRLPLR